MGSDEDDLFGQIPPNRRAENDGRNAALYQQSRLQRQTAWSCSEITLGNRKLTALGAGHRIPGRRKQDTQRPRRRELWDAEAHRPQPPEERQAVQDRHQ